MMKNSHRYKMAVMLGFLLASLALQGQTSPGTKYYFPLIFKNGPAPLYATSYYIQNPNPTLIWDLGCQLGRRDEATPGVQDSLVILDFGKMWIFNSNYGIRTFSDPGNGYQRYNLSFAEVEERARQFAAGYWYCSAQDRASTLTLGIGTNNYDAFNSSNLSQENLRGIAEDFGRNWAAMINRLNAWGLQSGYSAQVLFTGAIDIEWGQDSDGVYRWNTPYVTRGWVDAFAHNNQNQSIFFNYGACVGCPTSPNPKWSYNSIMPWTQADIWYVSWGSKPAFSVPEIYRNDGVLALQWAAVSKYGSLYEISRIVFSGVMTQMQACQQRGGKECETLDNTPAEGWGQLVDAVNADPATTSPLPRWTMDIKWQIR